jgi:hypothetical protein
VRVSGTTGTTATSGKDLRHPSGTGVDSNYRVVPVDRSSLLTVAIGLAAAPWLNVRRLRAMNLPSALRCVE